jgi:hypothetical protein
MTVTALIENFLVACVVKTVISLMTNGYVHKLKVFEMSEFESQN